jgi:CYTH domain-containing protein
MMKVVASEIERKFLVPTVPGSLELGSGARLRQGYLAIDGAVEVRLRRSEQGSVLTLKVGTGLARTEVELDVTEAEADELWPSTEGRRIEKVRHRVALDSGEALDLDVYEGALQGLVTAEVEFADAAAATAFVAPEWCARELTGDRAWSNALLALHGRPS